jgi:transcriptional regulator with XRE-family HTH domain
LTSTRHICHCVPMPAKRPDENTIAMGKTIARLRDEKRWTQGDLASRLTPLLRGRVGDKPVDQTLITRWEAGRRDTSALDLAALAKVFGLPVEILLLGTDPLWEPPLWAEWNAWESRARLDAARERLEQAAREYGEVRAAFDPDELEDDAATIAARLETEGWNAEMGRQNG